MPLVPIVRPGVERLPRAIAVATAQLPATSAPSHELPRRLTAPTLIP